MLIVVLSHSRQLHLTDIDKLMICHTELFIFFKRENRMTTTQYIRVVQNKAISDLFCTTYFKQL